MKYDLAIIGGGPAGAAAGVYAARKQLKTVLITMDWNGQSSVSTGIENWVGTVKLTGLELAANFKKHVQAYAGDFVTIKEGEACTKVERAEGGFKVTTDKGEYASATVLVATGSHRKKLEAAGADRLEHKGLTYCASCDGPLFAGQDVAVVGGGNAAFETAAQLLAYCKSVTLLNRSDKFRADPGTIETVSKNPHFRIINNAVAKEVFGEKFVEGLTYTDTASGKEEKLAVTGIFVEIGSIPTTGFVSGLAELDQYGHIKVDPRTQRSSLNGIWAAGDCTDGLYHQNNIAAGDAVKALEDIYLFLKAK